jgi:chromate reductase
MSKNILAFGASSSRQSINKKFATWAAGQLEDVNVEVLDLNDFEMPIYSADKETENGVPQLAHDFKTQVKKADAIVISFAEHNGSYSAAFKNIFDWVSRIEKDIWNNAPMLLLATSPGGRGGMSVLATAVATFTRATEGGVWNFSLPSFHQNFSKEGIKDADLSSNFKEQLDQFASAVTSA